MGMPPHYFPIIHAAKGLFKNKFAIFALRFASDLSATIEQNRGNSWLF